MTPGHRVTLWRCRVRFKLRRAAAAGRAPSAAAAAPGTGCAA